MHGSCSIRFEADKTIFEMSCPAPEPEPFDEASLNSARLSSDVWAVGVEDSPQQRRVLQLIFRQLGIPTDRVTILGGDDQEILKMGEYVAGLFKHIPPDAAILLVVDENLDLEGPSEETISGSLSVDHMRQALSPADESRLLAVSAAPAPPQCASPVSFPQPLPLSSQPVARLHLGPHMVLPGAIRQRGAAA
jgi:hypothetical protein